MRAAALVIAVLLAVPACIALLRPSRAAGATPGPARRRPLEAVWVVVPFALLVVLAALAAVA